MLHNGYTFAQISELMQKAGIKGCGAEILMPNDRDICGNGIYCVYCDTCVDDYYIKYLSQDKKERITIGHCKDCKHKEVMDLRNTCTCKNITEDTEWYNDKEINNSNKLIYSYYEDGRFYVGDSFGCVHFKEK